MTDPDPFRLARFVEAQDGSYADALAELWLGRLHARDCHSPLWKWRRLFLTPGVGAIFERAIGFRNPIF